MVIFAWLSLAKYVFIPLKENQPKQMKNKNQSIVMILILKSISTSMQESGSTMTKQVLWVDAVVYFRNILNLFLPKAYNLLHKTVQSCTEYMATLLLN